MPADLDVLIVGAGPVGLFLANECARQSLRWRLVEAHATQSIHSKALAIFPGPSRSSTWPGSSARSSTRRTASRRSRS
jgi:2-polyprenyl-6-methoxyphenol hydroxylase-like FAD-dependent oxidoreductase